ncbi:MAG: homocysteine S-methyltransferase family protein [Aquihabitans sp.]
MTTLPQLLGHPMVSDGGMETDLIFHHGVDLPHFAAFPLLDDPKGMALLADYYDGYATIARSAGVGLMLESPTWRASTDWGALLGYDLRRLAEVNRAAMAFLHQLRDAYSDEIVEMVVSGMVGPRGDGYQPGPAQDPAEAMQYHLPQVRALAEGGADVITAYTLTDLGEAIGVTRAAREVGVSVAISFTVETDGRLPSGETLANAIEGVDSSAAPDYYLVNCAHPEHIERALDDDDGEWRQRIIGTRANASVLSHAELDEATGLDDGDPTELAAGQDRLRTLLPNLAIVGGCCGTDARHVEAMWGGPHNGPIT